MLALPLPASAGKLLDYLRDYDLNDYSLGVALSSEQRPYLDTKNSNVAYPYLTTFTHPAFRDDWLMLTDGELGARKVTQSGFSFGGIGRIETLGFGSDQSDELDGMDPRQWTIEVAPFVSYRGWPVHVSLKAFKEISGRHGGWTDELRLTLPGESDWGYIVPGVELRYYDNTYMDYYYGVTPGEAAPGRPEYDPGPAMSVAAVLRVGYRITDHWLLTGNVSYELPGDEITSSPIVERDTLWVASVGVAYNADIFQKRAYVPDSWRMPRFDFRVGLFRDSISTTIIRDDENGDPGEEINLEDELGASNRESVLQLDAIYRIGNYHRLEVGYFDLTRDSSATTQSAVSFGDETFPGDTEIKIRSDLRVIRIAYAYSIMNDAQKELGIVAGLHLSRFETAISAPDTGQQQLTSVSTPLPVVGLHGAVAIGSKMRLAAELQIFRMQFNNYEGSMNYINLTLQRRLGQSASAGIGFNYYGLKLDSDLSAISGSLNVMHRGPYLFVGMNF